MGSIATGGTVRLRNPLSPARRYVEMVPASRTPLRDAEGKIIRWYGLNPVIDDRKRAEEKLRRSEAFLADAQRLSKTGASC